MSTRLPLLTTAAAAAFALAPLAFAQQAPPPDNVISRERPGQAQRDTRPDRDSNRNRPVQRDGHLRSTSADRTSPVLPPPGENEEQLAELLREGATMEEIAKLRDPVAADPQQAVRALKTGNARFFGGQSQRPDLSANERRAQILGQTPFAVVLGCSDSRVPTELVYDQSLGSLFVIRVAGNVVEPATAGSVEYAVEHLKSHVVVVMGHEGCGAVAAAMLPDEKRRGEPENVQFLLDRVRPAVERIPEIRDKKARMREAVINNVRHQVHQLRQNPTVARAEKQGRIKVIGAYYEIGSGAVDFLETDEELRLDATPSPRNPAATPAASH